MPKLFARSVTPRAVGVSILVAVAVAAALVPATGGLTSSSAPRPESAAGSESASSGAGGSQAFALDGGPIVRPAVHHDVSPPLRAMRAAPSKLRGPRLSDDERDKTLPSPRSTGQPDPVVQTKAGTGQIPGTSVSFEGISAGSPCDCAPPDPNAAAGPSDVFEIANADIAIYSKNGATVLAPEPTNTLWSGFGGGCQTYDNGDGTVVYDRIADRWIVQQFMVTTTPFLECVAVSTSGDPTGSYNRYSFAYGTDFPDYPKLGVWPDGYYTTYNIFANGTTFTGPEACALDRTKMLAGQGASQQCFKLSSSYGSLLPSALDGPTLPPAGSPNFLLSFDTNSLLLWKFHVDWTTPGNSTLSGPTTIATASFSPACGGGVCIPQSGTSQPLDSLGDRLMYRLAYRNFGNHESLVVDHSVGTSVTGMRWYELRDPNGTPTIFQQGTYQPDSTYRWMGSIAMDHTGDMGMGFSVSSSSLHPGIRYTGRLVGDPLGQMGQGEGTIITGAGSQNGGLYRWGDYTSMSVDPADDCTFWYTNEYLAINGSFNWHTRIGAFKFPSCTSGPLPTVTSFSPANGPVGTPVDIQGTNFTGATSVSFNGTSDPGFQVLSPTEISAHVPSGASTGPISVTTPNGTGTSATSFTVTGGPTITSFSPDNGPEGTLVDIQGTNLLGATGVSFNGTADTSFVVNSDVDITAHVPTGATTGPISVIAPSGTGTSSTNFTVISPPTVTSFSPMSGPVGTMVAINGTNFTGATAVKFNGTPATSYTVNSSIRITATVPSGATTGKISVSAAGGTGTSAGSFTVTAGRPPTITNFTPTFGRTGAKITINGTGFTGTTSVKLGAVSAAFTVNSASKITATVPAMSSGRYRFSVTTSLGTGTSSGMFYHL
jgi:hypothetical protein